MYYIRWSLSSTKIPNRKLKEQIIKKGKKESECKRAGQKVLNLHFSTQYLSYFIHLLIFLIFLFTITVF